MRQRALARIAQARPHTVIIAALWTIHDRDRIIASIAPTMAELRSAGVQRIVVIGPFPIWWPTFSNVLLKTIRDRHLSAVPEYLAISWPHELSRFEARLTDAAVAAGGEAISAIQLLCRANGEATSCRVWADHARTAPITADHGNLTPEGSDALPDWSETAGFRPSRTLQRKPLSPVGRSRFAVFVSWPGRLAGWQASQAIYCNEPL